MKFSTRGLKTYLQTLKTVPVPDDINLIHNTKPVRMFPANPLLYVDGDLVKIDGTGWSCLDSRYFKIRNINGNPTGLPIVAAVTNPVTPAVTITFSGGPAARPGNVAFSINAGAGVGTFIPRVSIPTFMTANQLAAATAAYLDVRVINGIPIRATRSGAVVTVVKEAGGSFTGFSASMIGTSVGPPTGSFELECSDGSAQPTHQGAIGTISRLRTRQAFVPFCISSFNREVPAAEPVSVASFCDPQAVVTGDSPSRGTITWGGPVDYADLGFCEMRRAFADGKQRLILLEYPNGIGAVVIPIVVNQFSETLELNAGTTWTGSGLVQADPSYILAAQSADGSIQCGCSCP